MKLVLPILLLIFSLSCNRNAEEINELFEKFDTEVETATDVKVIYSDSAKVKMIVSGPYLERHVSKTEPKDIFPKGVRAEFLNNNKKTISWLEGKYLERTSKEGLVIVRDSVVLYNAKNEKLESSELIWDEVNEKIYTDKFVRITQPEKGDTSYGFGFETNKDFSEFIIKNNFSAKMNLSEINSALGQ